jgi:membrane-associated phospholipid phosphatase
MGLLSYSELMLKVGEIGLMSYTSYLVCIVVLGIYLLFLYYGVEAHHFDFIERDPELSLPLLTEHFSCNVVTAISVVFPVLAVLSILIRPYNKRHQANMPTLRFGLWMYLGLGLALLTTYCVTNTIKLAVGMPRPNCFAMCNYQGYNEAVNSNDFTVYDDLTVAGAFGKRANCLSSNSFYKSEAFLSFPSGHASIISASATFIVLSNYHAAAKASFWLYLDRIVSGLAVILAVAISVSRIIDYWHRTVDVAIGALVGISCSAFWFYVTMDKIKNQGQTFGSVQESEASSDSLKSPFLRYEAVAVADSTEDGELERMPQDSFRAI